MKVMFREAVEPFLKRASGRAGLVRSLHTFGISESLIGERLFELMAEDHDPQVATQAHDGIITIRLTSRPRTTLAARLRIEAAETEVRAQLGEAVSAPTGPTHARAGRRRAAGSSGRARPSPWPNRAPAARFRRN